MEYKITLEQINQILNLLRKCELEIALPVVDLLRSITVNQEIKAEKAEEVEK